MANEFQTDKPGVMFYHTLYPQLDMLSPSECGELFRAILEYSMTGAYGSLPRVVELILLGYIPMIDRDARRYYERRERARAAARQRWGSDADACGGMPEDAAICQ